MKDERRRCGFAAPAELFGATRATGNLHPIAELSAENCTEQLGCPGPGTSGCRISAWASRRAAAGSCSRSTSCPRAHAVEAILALERLRTGSPRTCMISEIRAIAADDLWLSPCYERDCVAIHFTWKPTGRRSSRLLPVIESELAPFEPRPHWGKLFTLDRRCCGRATSGCRSSSCCARQYDPRGKFRNDFLDRNVFGPV